MKSIVKKISVLILLSLFCISFFAVSVHAASYPMAFFFSDSDYKNLIIGDDVTVGSTYIIRMKWYAEYNHEGYDLVIYDSNNTEVASSSNTFTNIDYSRYFSISWDTSGMKPGRYTVEVTKKFYSLYRWNEAPTKDHLYLNLICDHTWDSGKVTTAPTATNPGVRTYTCTNCGETKTEEIPADSVAKAVIDRINALPATITLNDRTAVEDARAAYNALSETQKGLITNSSTLFDAELTINRLAAEKATAEKATAEKAAAEPITIAKTPASVKAKAKKNKVTISWKKIKKNKAGKKLLSHIQGIQIQASTDPAFSSIVTDKRVGKNKTKVTLNLQKKTVYYVRVRYVGADGVSNWKRKRVRTK